MPFQRATASKPRLSELNPLVRVNVVEVESVESVIERLERDSTTANFDLVIASDMSTLQFCKLDNICKTMQPPSSHLLQSQEHPTVVRSLPFIAVNTFGLFGFFFLDLGNHIYTKYVNTHFTVFP